MDLIKVAIRNPVGVLAAVILSVMGGLLSLSALPYQLTPDVSKPEVSVRTTWKGASPYEIEREILEPQEEKLKSIPGLESIESIANMERGTINLTFRLGIPVREAVLEVSNKLDEVNTYPDNVDRPYIRSTGDSANPAVRMFLRTLPENPRPVSTYKTFMQDEIVQYFERIPGAAQVDVRGGTNDEVHIIASAQRLAAYGLTISDLVAALSKDNMNISAGDLDVGRHNYRVRMVGEHTSIADVAGTVIRGYGDRFVRVGDVADVRHAYTLNADPVLSSGAPGIGMFILPQQGVNVVELTNEADAVTKRLNEDVLKPLGVRLDWVYEQRPYINSAISLVRGNIFIGGTLAILVLLVFLRSVSATSIISLAIPISAISTFMFMKLADRNLNVISLAGISFSVGMLVDNAIVVLENIDRHRSLGKSPFAAAYDGTREVWGAVLSSTLTTVVVFLPILFMRDEAGQLFKDIALAITAAISLSAVVSMLVVPMLAERIFSFRAAHHSQSHKRCEWIATLGERIADSMMALVRLCLKNTATRLGTVIVMVGASALATWAMFPKVDYLPQGNQNMITAIMDLPPGLSTSERQEMADTLGKALDPYYGKQEHNGLPGISRYFFVANERRTILGVSSTQEQNAPALIPLLTELTSQFPAVRTVVMQRSIFASGLGKGRNIDVDLSGSDLPAMSAAAAQMMKRIGEAIPGARVRPQPSIELIYPEMNFIPDRERLASVGMTPEELGIALDVLLKGRKVDDFKRPGEKSVDMLVMGDQGELHAPEDLERALLVTRDGEILPVEALAKVERTGGMNEVRRLNQKRTITLQVTPPNEMPLQEAMDILSTTVIPDMEHSGDLRGLETSLSGTASKLTQTFSALRGGFLVAVAITYLLLAALFGNFAYPALIMLAVPLASAGGFIGLKLVNVTIAPQQLDVLTMLGFVMLVGIVVNNPILIVHQSLINVREKGMDHLDAVVSATRSRLRPIFMSATTSFLGMLPLVVAPGAGSELYRGLGAVVLGGLMLSTVMTVYLVPSLLAWLIRMEKPGSALRAEAERG
ncbi:HAE1 family hydrophobic/amphiphilic exporter-1 [Desulfobaculum xiamenense]|uniref:HAE1 family hydrophobic/amphiphilic exporter-1 n=1 Tax=Desulfobaculum xiamenense TaxID=995050 RepID=A0A846QCG1_9BACT|nr:efflux RND transporter permease subunit [Desulfobaculum xiamenense]NJB66396.1 HAE1 family hydrophobic/amphiphilic exporter-1 [Desulfobaculum xiamenense]